MISRALTILIAAALLYVPLANTGYSQSTKVDDRPTAEAIKKKVDSYGTGEKAKVKVKLGNGSSTKGYISQAGSEEFTVVEKSGSSRNIKYSEVVKIGRGGNSLNAKIGAAVLVGGIAAILLGYLYNESRR